MSQEASSIQCKQSPIDEMWQERASMLCGHIDADKFFKAVQVWINKPHVVNRRLCGSKIISHHTLQETNNLGNITPHLAQFKKCLVSGNPFDGAVKQFLEGCQKCGTNYDIKPEDQCDSYVDTNPVIEKETLQSLDMDTQKGETMAAEHGSMQPETENKCLQDHEDVTRLSLDKEGCLHVIIRDLLPKQVDRFHTLREVILLDKISRRALFLPLCHMSTSNAPLEGSTDQCYQLKFVEELEASENKICVDVYEQATEVSSPASSLGCSVEWLREYLLPRIVGWSQQDELQTGITSLKLVQVDRYNQIYQHLKSKYARHLVEIWPERTDPQKFVYEDIAIASYLLCLWQSEREEQGCEEQKQSFVDLGCGNGLLVYLLASEGHAGLGLDVRKRGIWDLYGPHVKLKECSITPSDETLFPEYDWLIGNHSDELTPWIPVIAARSSYRCRYFVLPCCAYDFHGKFGQKESGLSQYRSYLKYVELVGQKCGFKVIEDTLRIPSTKKICFIGQKRSYSETEETAVDQSRTAFIQERAQKWTHKKKSQCKNQAEACVTDIQKTPNSCSDDSSLQTLPTEGSGSAKVHLDNREQSLGVEGIISNSNDKRIADELLVEKRDEDGNRKRCKTDSGGQKSGWIHGFEARSSEEKIRNCTKVDKDIRDLIVKQVFDAIMCAEDGMTVQLSDGRTWKKGGVLGLKTVAEMFDAYTLKQLKSECGGLQTLLRNYYYIFRVQGGQVHLRDWSTEVISEPRRSKKKGKKQDTSQFIKTRLCWFHCNHPDGCPLNLAECTFAHGQEDLKTHEKT